MNVLLTGANGDIGYSILQYLLQANYHVDILDKNLERLTEHSNVSLRAIDLSNINTVKTYQREINKPYDVLIYAAGIREIYPTTKLSIYKWYEVLNVNLTSAFVLSQRLIQLAHEHKKPLCIIYISSISGLYGEPERIAYCASKHGLIGLCKALSLEHAVNQVRVNAIAPGIIDTELTRPYKKNSKTLAQINSNVPLRRWGQPEHIVKAVDFIMHNDYVTGSTLVVDGGWTAGKTL